MKGKNQFLDGTDFVGVNKRNEFYAVRADGTRFKCVFFTLPWARKNWKEVP